MMSGLNMNVTKLKKERKHMKVTGIVREVYGNRWVYLKEKTQENAIIKLTGKKTLSDNMISGLRELGLEVDIINPYLGA